MADVIIKVSEITTVTGHKYKIINRNDDSEIVWIKEPNLETNFKGEPELIIANQSDLLSMLVLNINSFKGIRAPNDGEYAPRLFSALLRYKSAQDKSQLILNKHVYDWVHRLLNREIPLSEEDKKLEPRPNKDTLASALWGLSDRWFIEQLKSIDDRKYHTLEDMPLAEEKK